jgi:hypothetical protein
VIRRSWRTQLKAATTQQAVLSVVSQFLDEWSPHEVSALPPRAWPATLASKDDVVQHAVRLSQLHADLSGSPGAMTGLGELLLFFTHAAVRISHLAAIAAVQEPSPPATPQRKAVTDGEA